MSSKKASKKVKPKKRSHKKPESKEEEEVMAPTCRKCKKRSAEWSSRTKRYIQLCQACNEKKRKGNRASYHKRHADDHKKASMEHQLATARDELFRAQSDVGDMRERLAVAQKRYDALQDAYEESQKMLAEAIDSANKGKPSDKLPSALSVRNESVVVQRLQEITEVLLDQRAQEAGSEASVIAALRNERQQYTELFDHTIRAMEQMMEGLCKARA